MMRAAPLHDSIVAGRSVSLALDNRETVERRPEDKPPYRVPSMAEIRALPLNGFTVASTFAGGGGSSCGYRMAGFKVVYANEVVPIARESYAANMDPATVLDGNDIRQVTAADVLRATGLSEGELDVFDGSPPCVSFSTAGKREAGWGRVTASHDIVQRHDDLFHEFARLLKGLQPRVFVAENVSGLIKGTAKGYFLEILRTLRSCGYQVEARLLDAQWLGVPQMRQRLIFVGVRDDLKAAPALRGSYAIATLSATLLPWIIAASAAAARFRRSLPICHQLRLRRRSRQAAARVIQGIGSKRASSMTRGARGALRGSTPGLMETLLIVPAPRLPTAWLG